MRTTLATDTWTTVVALVSPGSSPNEISSGSWVQDELDEVSKAIQLKQVARTGEYRLENL